MTEPECPEGRDRRPAPKLVLESADGELLSLTQLRGRPVLVSFLSHAA
jgi:peroxiredoxin